MKKDHSLSPSLHDALKPAFDKGDIGRTLAFAEYLGRIAAEHDFQTMKDKNDAKERETRH